MQSPPSPRTRRSEVRALWALCWRMVLLTPVVAVLGTVVLAVILGLTLLLPFLAVLLVISADYLWAALTLIVWLLWLRFGGPVRRLVFEGFEHGSL